MPVSFSTLPIKWSDSKEDSGAPKEKVYVRGYVDRTPKMLPVKAWRFDLSSVKPSISLLQKNGKWVSLQNPRKSFEGTIRTILVTVHFLHYAKKNPKLSSARSVWDNLAKVKELSSYKLKPSLSDLLKHMPLISEAAKRDDVLAKSKLLLTILEENPGDKKLPDEVVEDLGPPGFVKDEIYNDMIDEASEESESDDDDDDLFNSVCALCDNGGNLVCCDGACMRSFHATEEDGRDSLCDSLGLTQKEVDKKTFYCQNCQHNQHQCFACGKLGSSGQTKGAEVIKCASATCCHFYHPHCVAKLLPQVVKHDAAEPERSVAEGDRFMCPVHYCCVCKELENKTDPDLQFAVCQRCPKAYHRKCLPREIVFEDTDDEGSLPRAWEGLLPNNRILIYCLNHDLDDELGTPIRDHIKFPNFKATAKKKMKPSTKEKVISNKNNADLDKSSVKSTAKGSKVIGTLSSGKVGCKKSENINSGSNISRKPKSEETPRRRPSENQRSISKKSEMPDCKEDQPSCALMNKGSMHKPDNQWPSLDADSKRRLLALVEEVKSEVTLDSVKKQFAPHHSYSLKNSVEAITKGKLEGSVDAIQTALRKLEDGCSIQDVETVCNPDVVKQIFKWKDKLKVYLAPVLYGNRHTSYGRHITHVKKLEGIVDKLHWYVQNGDTIVDFCCGANEFSILMKKKLEESGKKCSYKNYDKLPTKNDFSFEMRDWLAVHPNELPTGSQLIMGLRPPFGVKTTFGNKFIDKALEFKPKLLILIAPIETERLAKKLSSYDIVWEDENFLSDMSFYLPGSVDVNDKQKEQWYAKPHVLSLWSRRDWTTRHKVIAREQSHLSSQPEVIKMDTETLPTDHDRNGNNGDKLMLSHDLLESTDDKKDQASMDEGKKISSHHRNVDQQSKEEPEHTISKSGKTSRKRKHRTERNDGRGPGLVSPAKRQAVNEIMEGGPDHSHPNPNNGRSSVEGSQPPPVICSNVEAGDGKVGPSVVSPLSDSSVTNTREEQDSREEEKHQRDSDVKQHDSVVRMGSMGSEPTTVSRIGTGEHSVPQPGCGAGLPGFASGPNSEYARRHSCGWLDE
ncbi:hypothetical protein RIF29_18048 [Crotalaria pallida]|uniref:Zinc finger PHD-type domain-containing protein n=1 Tax=Crotalaria pallida TaxID=3830 RepID=A0AAN9FP58_CROPI